MTSKLIVSSYIVCFLLLLCMWIASHVHIQRVYIPAGSYMMPKVVSVKPYIVKYEKIEHQGGYRNKLTWKW